MNHDRSRSHGLWTAASLIGLSIVSFWAIDTYNAAHSLDTALRLQTPLDALIPFVPAFVFAYVLYYPWLLIPLVVVRRVDDLYRVIVAFALLQFCAAVTFLALPSRMIRPSSLPDTTAGTLLRAIYDIDPGWNAFPSLHVGHSVLVAVVCWRYRRDVFPIAVSGTAMISASTVLIKQHYIIDVFGGALLAWACLATSHAIYPMRSRMRAIVSAIG